MCIYNTFNNSIFKILYFAHFEIYLFSEKITAAFKSWNSPKAIGSQENLFHNKQNYADVVVVSVDQLNL